ncbi:MAG: PKD domain-containing protein, partial [Bacteroidia bacterium]
MRNSDNIEKLFKEKFEHFEADVNPNAWSNVQQGIQSVPGAGTAASKLTVGKIIAGAVSVAAVAGSVWYFSQTGNNGKAIVPDTNQHPTEIVSKEIPQTLGSENKSQAASNTSSSYKQPISSINPSSPANQNINNQNQQQNTSDVKNETTTDVYSSDNSSSSSPSEHKYGNAPKGPTSMIRENHAQNSQQKSQNNNSSDNQEAEQAPTAVIFASVESGDVPLTVNFSNQGSAAALNWNFGDSSVSRENGPTHTFTKPGIYTVTLTAKNSIGNASDKKIIEVKSISAITLVPNIFTPNGDNVDDSFSIGLKNIASIEVTITDMTSKTVYI